MSKIRNLPEVTTIAPSDLVYVVDVSEGPNAGRKATIETLKQAVIADAGEIPYDNNNSTLAATDVRDAIDELDDKVNDHSNRHLPDGVDGLTTAAPVTATADGNNNIGTANSFSRADHKHNVVTGTPISQAPDQTNDAGVSSSLARADHRHNIPTDAPITPLTPATTNAEGVGTSFARNDHTHAIATALVGDISTIQPDDAASAGIVNTYARGDHKHAIVAAAPTTILSPATANAEGSGTSFARNDHTHSIATGLVGEISTIQPDDAAAAGTIDKFARIDHKHPIVAAAATSISTSTTNTEGSSTSFARADHTHVSTITNQEITATADDTEVSTASDILMDSMTVTPAAGSYFVMWTGSILNSANGAERTWISLYSGGSQVSATERSIGTAGGVYVPSMTQAIITVNGSQAIELRWRVAGGTSTVHSRRLTLLKVG